MLIAQISDTHIAGWGKKTYGCAPMAENLECCVAAINRLKPLPNVVVVTGDISKDGLKEEFERAATILNKLTMPFYVIPGNHDDRSLLWSIFGSRACPAPSGDFINYIIDDYEVRLIGLDSTISDQPGGEISSCQVEWLDKHLAEAQDKPTVLFMHHPPVKFAVLETDVDGFGGAERLGEIIEKYPHIERLLCGHIHLPADVRWHGTVVSTAPSPGMKLVLDLTMTRESEFVLDAPSYQLHYWTPQKNLISHTVYLRDDNGPYLFEEQ